MPPFVVTAKRLGDQVVFAVEADDTKEALEQARAEANRIFAVGVGDAKPNVSVKPVPEEEGYVR